MTRPLLGVVGGLGPIASAEFLRTIYEHSPATEEQDMPAVLLVSNPAIPDRTAALARGARAVLRAPLQATVEQLIAQQCTRIVICCVTMHAVIADLPVACRSRILSLIDVAIDEIRARGERQLLMCSQGTRDLGLFDAHPSWPRVASLVVMPDRDDQASIHRMIHELKRTGDAGPHLEPAGLLLAKYGVRSLIAGCTEFHLLAKRARHANMPWRACDPLTRIAIAWNRQTAAAS
jgi:aspartate racemase